jgi:hypothetical protein
MSRRKRISPAVIEARAICEREFEPLWKPAPWTPVVRSDTALDRKNKQAAARNAAFAWLAVQLRAPAMNSFDDIRDLETLRRAWAICWNATINDVRRWADALEAAA